MKYQNQRPDLADQIKTLVQSANSTKTVPHGIKTVNPGEGLQLLSGDGAEIFWDWETAAEYDTRISEGRAAIDQARLDLDKAEADLAAGAARLDENERILDALGPRVDAAESTVAQASKDLTAVSGRLDATAGNLATLQGTVGDVQSAVVESDRKAAAAQAAADQASSAAGSAASKATAAQTTADQAKAAAGTADEAARAASGLAATKGEVIYQATAPTGSRAVAQNLWIRTTDNKPHTWNGSAWVAVTDKAATDAATAAATAQSAASTAQATADQAKADAAAAAQSASAAMTKAGQAQTSADGKNTITRSTSPASQPGKAVGDTHFTMSSMGGGGVVTRQQRWDGSTWQDEALSHQVLASLDLGKATVGELDGGRLRANSVTADRVLIGVGQNSVANPAAMTGAPAPHVAYGGGVKTGIAGSTSGNVFYTALTQGSWGDAFILKSGVTAANGRVGDFVLDPRSEYAFRLRTKKVSGTGSVRVKISVFNVSGGFVKNVFTPDTTVTATWSNMEVRLSASDISGGVSAAIIVQNPRDGEYWYEALDFRELGTGALFVDGSITGKQVDAESVAAKVGQFVNVKAANVEVTEDLSARVVNAMNANTKNLVVTESAVLQHTTLLGTTVADELNVRRLLRGRDAILTGTVDVAQLNVTEAMSAEIVNAMSVAAKKLVVTEDAILNRATVVQSLVTPELIADKANVDTLGARLVSAGAIVSRDSTGSVQIAPSGIILQNASPGATSFTRQVKLTSSGLQGGTRTTQTVNIDGENNWMTGTFRTGTSGPRISMLSGPSSGVIDLWGSATDGHGSAWYDTTSSDVINHSLTLMGISDYSSNTNNPAIRMFPYRGTFAFQGRWAQDTGPMKFVVVTNSSGLSAGQYNTFSIPYRTNFPTNNALRFPFVSVESENGADMMVTIVTQTQSAITINVINKSGSKASGALIVKIVTFNVGSY